MAVSPWCESTIVSVGSEGLCRTVGFGDGPAAFAQTLRHSDPAHDVQEAGSKVTDAPDNKTADTVRVTLAHTSTKVSAKTKLRDYRPGTWFYVEDLKTATRTYEVQGNHTSSGTTFTLTRGRKTVSCDGLTSAIDRSRNTLVVTVPTSCLQDPRWVKVGVGYIRQSSRTLFADDALRRAGISENALTLSKRLKK